MNKFPIYLTALALIGCGADKNNTTVTWENLGNDGTEYTQRITVKGDMNMDMLAFNMLARPMRMVNPEDTLIEFMPGYYAISSSRFPKNIFQDLDSLVFEIVTRGTITSRSYAPDGFHRIEKDGSTTPVKYVRKPLRSHYQWCAPGGWDQMPYGQEIYEINSKLQDGNAGIYDVVPSYKKVELTGGDATLPLRRVIRTAPSDKKEYYTLQISGDSIVATAADEKTARLALDAFEAMVLSRANGTLPCAVIEDWPDFEYRGLMVDVSRNFQSLSTLKKIVDYMAQYRMNRLHLHFIDDEGWRIEIPSLPELTSFAGCRGYSPNESEWLYQLYSGDGNPYSTTGVSNGYYTKDEFIDFLKYAYDRGICVIPEVETPGHARAAVKAMEYRYRNTGDDTFRLIHDGDSSVYTTAQNYHDNVMNPALDGPYNFVAKVIDEIKDMYVEANVPLLSIHIGGDEVARGAWSGSDAVSKLMEKNGLEDQTAVHGYFVDKVSEIMRDRNVPISGWQEIAVGHSPEYNQRMAPMVYSVNCWTESSDDPEKSITAKALRAGFPVVMSNVNHFYFDLCYNRHPEEPGLKWGGVVDEFQSLHGYPSQLSPVNPDECPGTVIGLSGHLFSETIRSAEMLEMYLFPKMLGLAERAWNANPTYSDKDFNALIYKYEIPRWHQDGRNYHLKQPGISKQGDNIYIMNSPYPDAEIRYTTDGSEPNSKSNLYSEPISTESKLLRAKLFLNGKSSLETFIPEE